ncbi:zinc-dependent alcohol dehydrogenase family protein [Corallococcus carmarthensis]|uniref:zinc-dependent alcohol dehydrogenase family protein n=1 Tax=Corallococcus carmarthensis TaxID=2316728 RepID=UPI00148C97EF|nr:NAD(P)-dependent alcohol dehydrogenase [Corallococcus carmarthensis]NOK16532.1 NAD(P)-dependent alcohol dehydrogenase [Corallococcus carmarthensis]
MQAYELQHTTGASSWTLVETPQPQPGPGQALVRIHAVSLNYRDLVITRGTYPGLKLPLIPCSDGAGQVVAVGHGVTRVKVGDRVSPTFFQVWTDGERTPEKVAHALGGGIPGVLSEYVCLDAEGLVVLPDWLSYEEGATLPCAAVTAWNALVPQGGLKARQTVLAQGTGGVSIFALQFARILGARVLITSSQDAKLQRAKQLGADGLINYRQTPDWEKAVLTLTGGQGVDHVLEVGGAGTLPRSVEATKEGGHIALIGLLTGAPGKPDISTTSTRHLRVVSTYVGSREMFEDMLKAMTQEKTRPVIDRVFPFTQAREALRHMESGGHFGKIVITV